jgi:SNF2 family DNA or RNA helicase
VVSLITGELVREQVVVWFAFNRELARVWQALKKAGVEATWVAGEVGMDERRRRAGLFQEGKRRVMLAQIKCARMGVDLSAADTEIYFSNSWSFEDRKQSEDRIEHPNKKATLLVIDLVTEGTVDEDVVETMKERRADTAWFVSKVMQTRRMP